MSIRAKGSSYCVFPISQFKHGLFEKSALSGNSLPGVCTVCGRKSLFENFTENLRESGTCSNCGSNNRQRQMAFILRKTHNVKINTNLAFPPGLRIYNTESSGAVHQAIKGNNNNYIYSEYFGNEYRSGDSVNGIMHQDLQNLSITNDCIDLTLSSDVMEHMPDPYLAHSEIHRILVPNGMHIFTVPFANADYHDQKRAVIESNGKIKYLEDAIYHDDPIRPKDGVLVWYIFALEMLVKLKHLGFNTEMWLLHEPLHGIIGPCSLIFVARKNG
ncbi:MAG: class I SAM-dependent methyltransferase [Desulfobulbaceae bacterium]|nr:class I SAM-dependent methyltransferase [Desulfobulbaceae bacterium]